MRPKPAAGVMILTALLVTGCSSAPKEAALGEPLAAQVRHSDVEATAEITVTSVTARPVSELTEELQLAGEYRDGTVFLVGYEAKIIDGEYPADSTYGFSEYNWTATGAGDAEVATVQAFHQVRIDGCDVFDQDLAAALADGNLISACTIFVSEQPDASLDKVTYGQAAVSRRGAGTGWQWTI